MNFWNLFIGIAIGIGVGVYLLNAFVPNANQLIAMYQFNRHKVATSTTSMAHSMPSTQTGGNPYAMAKITSEKQFVEEMVLHHQAAVTMSQQLLALNPRSDIGSLAKNIINTQSTEIKIMKDCVEAIMF